MDQSTWLSGMALCLGAAGLIQIVHSSSSRLSERRKLNPPGPRGKWFIGNLFDIPASFPWLRFSEWGKTYGAYAVLTRAVR